MPFSEPPVGEGTPGAPGGWELKRDVNQIRTDLKDGFAQIHSRLDDLAKNTVTSREHASDMARLEDRYADLARDIAEEKAARATAISDERVERQRVLDEEKRAREKGDKQQQEALDRLIANQKWIVVAILVPIALFIANMVLIRS